MKSPISRPSVLFTAAVATLQLAAPAHAATLTETYTPSTLTTVIPDDNAVFTSFLTTVASSSILSLTQVTISLDLRGTSSGLGFASDMAVTLMKSPVGVAPSGSDSSAILLNRVGINAGNPVGMAYDGWNITLSDSGASDIHLEAVLSGVATGTFQPDGRANPIDTLRPSMLSVFNGGAGNGDWRLNVADLASGGTMKLVNWSLTLTGNDASTPIPEASTWAAGLGLAAVVGAGWWRARQRVGGRPSADGTPGSECKIMS